MRVYKIKNRMGQVLSTGITKPIYRKKKKKKKKIKFRLTNILGKDYHDFPPLKHNQFDHIHLSALNFSVT